MRIGESLRKAGTVQTISLSVALAHFVLIIALWQAAALGVNALLLVIFAQYAAAVLVTLFLLSPFIPAGAQQSWHDVLRDYAQYSRPLVLYSFFGFAYSFADIWLLQHLSGPREHAYLALGMQFAGLGFLVTNSRMQILLREITESQARGDHARMANLYGRVSRLLYGMSGFICGFLVFCSAEIIQIMLGKDYVGGMERGGRNVPFRSPPATWAIVRHHVSRVLAYSAVRYGQPGRYGVQCPLNLADASGHRRGDPRPRSARPRTSAEDNRAAHYFRQHHALAYRKNRKDPFRLRLPVRVACAVACRRGRRNGSGVLAGPGARGTAAVILHFQLRDLLGLWHRRC